MCECFREHHEKITDYVSLLFRKSDLDFFKCMRLTKKTFQFLVTEMERTERFSLQRTITRGKPRTSTSTALAATLWYLGNLNAQRDIAERFHISQGHLSMIVKDVVNCLCNMADTVIRWPNEAQIQAIEDSFETLANFPGVVGAIDGCHVPILSPDDCQTDYLDRNQNHSVNLLAVCDVTKKFTYCFAGFPGSVHDQRVFTNSALGHAVENYSTQHFASAHYHIIGDSAFKLHQHVMVPYKDTGGLTVRQNNYNKKLSQTRRVIENAFGFLKGRFRRLKRLECKLSQVPNNIIACCVLHNITVADETEIEMLLCDSDCTEDTGCEKPVTRDSTFNEANIAKRKRDLIAQSLLP